MKIVVLDTGCANLSSVRYAIERLGYQPEISYDKDIVLAADKLFLPGVGTTNAAMKMITERGLLALIQQITKPVLGICLGMQLLGNSSEEGNEKLLECIDLPVKKLKSATLPVPHMGWNTVQFTQDSPLFCGIADNSYFYFVHSYAMPINAEYTLAQTNYDSAFSSIVAKNNFFGVQFHPERSGQVGATLIKNFLEM